MHNQLTAVAAQIRDWQTRRNLSDSELCKKFSGLGSTKTYKRILDGELAELDLERWAIEYAQVWTLIELESSSGEEDEPIYDDLPHMTSTRLAVTDALQERGNNRLVIIEGPSGSGKTTAGRALAARFGRRIILGEADETWKDSLHNTLGGILRAMAARDLPNTSDLRRAKLTDLLTQTPACLVIDEAHHLGPRTLNIVKTILNQTKSQVVFLCISTLFRRLESAAYEEAKQLTANRLCERVRLSNPRPPEVEKFLERRLKWDDGALKSAAKVLAERAPNYGHWNFVNLVTRKCRQLAGPKCTIDQETFAKGMQKAVETR